MEKKEAVMAFSQSEKIKAGLIWISHLTQMLGGLTERERQGGEKVLGGLINMIIHETGIAGAVAGVEGWKEITSHLDKAAAMVHSGVGQEAAVHISRALSVVTNTGQRSMIFLKESDLL